MEGSREGEERSGVGRQIFQAEEHQITYVHTASLQEVEYNTRHLPSKANSTERGKKEVTLWEKPDKH